jgi:hypothetical protein
MRLLMRHRQCSDHDSGDPDEAWVANAVVDETLVTPPVHAAQRKEEVRRAVSQRSQEGSTTDEDSGNGSEGEERDTFVQREKAHVNCAIGVAVEHYNVANGQHDNEDLLFLAGRAHGNPLRMNGGERFRLQRGGSEPGQVYQKISTVMQIDDGVSPNIISRQLFDQLGLGMKEAKPLRVKGIIGHEDVDRVCTVKYSVTGIVTSHLDSRFNGMEVPASIQFDAYVVNTMSTPLLLGTTTRKQLGILNVETKEVGRKVQSIPHLVNDMWPYRLQLRPASFNEQVKPGIAKLRKWAEEEAYLHTAMVEPQEPVQAWTQSSIDRDGEPASTKIPVEPVERANQEISTT